MSANLDDIGIQSINVAKTRRLELEKALEQSPVVMDANGRFSSAYTYDPKYSFTVSGSGDLPASVGSVGTPAGSPFAITGVTTSGITIVTDITVGDSNTEENAWEFQGMNYPGAS